MPAKKNTKEQINLLPKSGFVSTTAGRVVGWLLGTFRVLVIVVEIVVIGAFFSRFWLDGKNEDLSDQITERVSVIKSFSETEKKLALVQQQLNVFSSSNTNKSLYSRIIEEIKLKTPDEVILNLAEVNAGGITLEGTSSTPKGVQQYIANIGASEMFDGVEIVGFEPSQENRVLVFFRIKANLTQ